MKNKVTVKNDLIKEKEDLDEKIMKLNNFIRGVPFVELGIGQKGLLVQQADAMTAYSLILRDRIVDITRQEVE